MRYTSPAMTTPTTSATWPPPAFHVMTKPRGAICNLDCSYCYYLAKERLYPGSRFRMADELLEAYVRQYIAAQRTPEVTFAWQGGEPTLMGLPFFERVVELQAHYRPPGVRVVNTLQTNGTTLDDSWCRFFRRHGFLVGISLDGPQELHDAYRVDKGGHPTFAQVMRGLQLLQRHGVEHNVLACVHAANAARPLEVYRFLRDEAGTRFLQFIPVVERLESPAPGAAPVTERSVSGAQYGAFLIAIFDEWVRRDVGRVFVQIFDVALNAWYGRRPGLCIFEETCGAALALEHTGDLYACDHFVEPAYRLGNIRATPIIELVASEAQQAFGAAKRETLPRFCRACDVRFACNGGCPKDRILATPDGEPGLHYLCAGYQAFFRHIDRPMRMMCELLRRGAAPAQVMGLLAAEDAQRERAFRAAGRNDPCPCGSGRKYKRCHGRAASGERRAASGGRR
ncbi:MAG TPA: anaerobic sulfatase maturase [Roseiflexaceae bacterium]|nr:anaerobic sulfatase maturase [Roseiflexaceae bacterium]